MNKGDFERTRTHVKTMLQEYKARGFDECDLQNLVIGYITYHEYDNPTYTAKQLWELFKEVRA